MTQPTDPKKPVPGLETHIADTPGARRPAGAGGTSMPRPGGEVMSATAATAPLLHFRTAPAYQAYRVLRWMAILLPLVSGADRFLALLTRWERYAPPAAVLRAAGLDALLYTRIAGAVELLLAALVYFLPRAGCWLLAAWLWASTLNLALLGGARLLALQLFLLSLAVIALERLAAEFHSGAPTDWER